jgi:hypothetical protein
MGRWRYPRSPPAEGSFIKNLEGDHDSENINLGTAGVPVGMSGHGKNNPPGAVMDAAMPFRE